MSSSIDPVNVRHTFGLAACIIAPTTCAQPIAAAVATVAPAVSAPRPAAAEPSPPAKPPRPTGAPAPDGRAGRECPLALPPGRSRNSLPVIGAVPGATDDFGPTAPNPVGRSAAARSIARPKLRPFQVALANPP